MNMLKAIEKRRSVRTFTEAPLSADELAQIDRAIASARNPLGGNFTIRRAHFGDGGVKSPGSYGLIKGATDWLMLAVAPGDNDAMAAGFTLEQIVLNLTEIGLGTCWIGGTFKSGDFADFKDWPEGQKLEIVVPFGYSAGTRLLERIERLAARSDSRKPFVRLFFDNDFATPLDENSSFGKSLAAVRPAPSSLNSQPWRALVKGDTVHFYSSMHRRMSLFDMGIALCHFKAGEEAHGYDGAFFTGSEAPTAPDGWRYIMSYTRKKETDV